MLYGIIILGMIQNTDTGHLIIRRNDAPHHYWAFMRDGICAMIVAAHCMSDLLSRTAAVT